jgi:phage terminase large subunit-like protein
MVASTIKTVDPGANVKLVHSSRGKAVRAEPVAALYEQGRAHHVGTHEELETEKTSWAPGDPHSPNRMDAEVFAMRELMLSSPLAEVFAF